MWQLLDNGTGLVQKELWININLCSESVLDLHEKKGRKCIKVSNRCMVAIKLRGPTINQLRISYRLMEHFCGSRSLSGLLDVDVGGLKQGRGMFFDILVLHIEEYI